jgi:hypothetical protein
MTRKIVTPKLKNDIKPIQAKKISIFDVLDENILIMDSETRKYKGLVEKDKGMNLDETRGWALVADKVQRYAEFYEKMKNKIQDMTTEEIEDALSKIDEDVKNEIK